MSMRKLRWIFPTFALTLAFLAVNGPVTGQAPQLPTGMVKSSPAKGLQAATPNVDYLPPASPAMTGTPTAPTATAGTNTTQVSTTAFVTTAVAGATGTTYAAGPGVVITPPTGTGSASISTGRGSGSWAFMNPVHLASGSADTTADSSFQTLDLSLYVPPGTTSAKLVTYLFTASPGNPKGITYYPGGWKTGGLDFNADGGLPLYAYVASIYHPFHLDLPVSSDRKILYKRVFNGTAFSWYIDLYGCQATGVPVLGAPQVLVAGAVNKYPSFPFAWTNPKTGTRLVAYRNATAAGTADHSSGGAAWLRLNEAAGTMLWDSTTFAGAEVQDVFPIHDPSVVTGSGRLVYHIRCFDAGTGFDSSYYSTSTDDGQTWAAPAALTLPAGFLSIHDFQFFDFIRSSDGTKIFATAYGQSAITGLQAIAFMQSSDGAAWTVRSWISPGQAGWTGNETGVCRMPDGRLVILARGNPNGTACGTAYSDDEGLTWSAVSVQTGVQLHCPRPLRATSNGQFFAIARLAASATFNPGLCYATFDRNGAMQFVSPPIFYGSPSHVGYAAAVVEPGGEHLYFYVDYPTLNQPALVKCLMEYAP